MYLPLPLAVPRSITGCSCKEYRGSATGRGGWISDTNSLMRCRFQPHKQEWCNIFNPSITACHLPYIANATQRRRVNITPFYSLTVKSIPMNFLLNRERGSTQFRYCCWCCSCPVALRGMAGRGWGVYLFRLCFDLRAIPPYYHEPPRREERTKMLLRIFFLPLPANTRENLKDNSLWFLLSRYPH